VPRYDASTWGEFETIVRDIIDYNKGSLTPLLFRGHDNAVWHLQTTLERRGIAKCNVEQYYKLILRRKPEIEIFTGLSWDNSTIERAFGLLNDYDSFSRALDGFCEGGQLPGGNYMAYLRHHGFPSPLLDWSRSPFVATFFAFRNPGAQRRAIYVLAEKPKNQKGKSSNESSIYSLRRVSKPHKRHYLQQSEYTVCVEYNLQHGWSFVSSKSIEERRIVNLEDWSAVNQTNWNANEQDVIFKITLPSDIRLNVLMRLDEFNLNAFSLFGSEESLMETMAVREIDKRVALGGSVGGS
jgi:hypothetical protein